MLFLVTDEYSVSANALESLLSELESTEEKVGFMVLWPVVKLL